MELKYKLISGGKAPVQATEGSNGLDLFPNMPFMQDWLDPNEQLPIPLGVSVCIPKGYVGLLVERSSLHKRGLILVNKIGVIDSDYRGELMGVLKNISKRKVDLKNDKPIVQLIIVPQPAIELIQVDELDTTSRGSGGFGSTGKH